MNLALIWLQACQWKIQWLLVHLSGPALIGAKALTAATLALHRQCKPQHSDSRINHETEWSYSVFWTSQHPLCLLLSIHIKDLCLVGVTLDEHEQNGESGHIRWFALLWDRSTVLQRRYWLSLPVCSLIFDFTSSCMIIKWCRCDVFFWLWPASRRQCQLEGSHAFLPEELSVMAHTAQVAYLQGLQWLCLPGLKSYNEQFLAFNELITSAFEIFNSFFFRVWMISLNMMPQLMR